MHQAGAIRLRTKFLSSDNLNNGRTIRVEHIMKALDMRETVLASKTGLKSR